MWPFKHKCNFLEVIPSENTSYAIGSVEKKDGYFIKGSCVFMTRLFVCKKCGALLLKTITKNF